MTRGPHAEDEAFRRVMRRRTRALPIRIAQAVLIGLLSGVATGDVRVAGWFVLSVAATLLETAAERILPGRLGMGRARLWILAGQALSTICFSAIVVLLLRDPNPIRLAEAVLLLCAVALSNALHSRGSPAAAIALVAPSSAALALGPLWVGFVRSGLPVADTVLLAVCGVIYTFFILRLSQSLDREGQALRAARHAAQAGEARWRLIFDQSPMARFCFDASALHEALQARAAGRTRLGDVLRSEVVSQEAILRRIRLIEVNQAAIDLCGERVDKAHFTDSFVGAFCHALNGVDAHGA